MVDSQTITAITEVVTYNCDFIESGQRSKRSHDLLGARVGRRDEVGVPARPDPDGWTSW